MRYLSKSSTRPKFGNKKTEYNGVTYDSKAEADYAAQLDLKVRAGLIRSWGRQCPIPFVVYGTKVCVLRVDFMVTHNDWTEEVFEVKGFETPVFKLKLKLFHALYPTTKFTLVKNGKEIPS